MYVKLMCVNIKTYLHWTEALATKTVAMISNAEHYYLCLYSVHIIYALRMK